MKLIKDESKFFDRDKVQSLYPGAYMIKTQGVGALRRKNSGGHLSELSDSGEYFAQLKKDGFSYSFEKTSEGSYLFGRSSVKATGLLSEKSDRIPHIVEALKDLPDGTILVGEIYYPGKTSKDVTSIMNSLTPKSLARQKEQGLIHYFIHDIIAVGEESLIGVGHLERYNILKNTIEKSGALSNSFIELADIYEDIDFTKLADSVISRGEEGIVLKKKNAIYQPDKSPAGSLVKVKKSDTVDVVCIGFDDSTKMYAGKETPKYWIEEVQQSGKWVEVRRYEGPIQDGTTPESRTYGITKPYYMGWKTALRIGAYDDNGEMQLIGTVSSGLTDWVRQAIINNPENYLNRVVECGIMEKEKDALRHPVFIGFRDDKDISECTIKSIFG